MTVYLFVRKWVHNMEDVKIHCDASVEEICKEVNRCSNQINNIVKHLKTEGNLYEEQYSGIKQNIYIALKIWCGQTYIGKPKEKHIKKNFQRFFCNLYEFLIECGKSNNPILKSLSNNALFQGTVYRYLGYDEPIENDSEPVEPNFNDIYVSWSKEKKFGNIFTKLYGTKTLLVCEIKDKYFGIDLEALGIDGDEYEVVFPTIRETIINIEYQYKKG